MKSILIATLSLAFASLSSAVTNDCKPDSAIVFNKSLPLLISKLQANGNISLTTTLEEKLYSSLPTFRLDIDNTVEIDYTLRLIDSVNKDTFLISILSLYDCIHGNVSLSTDKGFNYVRK